MLDLRIPGALCESCSLCAEDGIHPGSPVPGDGASEAWLVIVGEAPGYSEVKDGMAFVGASGRMLWKELARYDIDRRADCYVTNALLCPTPVGKPIKAKDIQACNARLDREIRSVDKRSVILALGASAATAIRGSKTRLGDVSGRIEWSERYQCQVVYAYHPAAILRNPDLFQEFAHAIGKLTDAREMPDGPAPVEPIEWTVETSVMGLIETLDRAKRETTGRLVIDIETTGLDPWQDRILSIGFAFNRTSAYIVPEGICYNPAGTAALKEFIEHPEGIRHIYHNGKFDTQVIQAQLGIYGVVGGDTMLLHYCLDERNGEMGGFHGLKYLSHKYCGAPAYAEDIDGANMALVPFDEMCEYQAHDLVYTYRLWDELVRQESREPASRANYPRPMRVHDVLLVPASEALRQVEMRGIRIDKKRLAELDVSYEQQYAEGRQALEDMLHSEDMLSIGFNPASPKQVLAALHHLGYEGMVSTAEESIHDLQRDLLGRGETPHPFLDKLLDVRSLKHTRATYITGVQKHLLRGPAGNDRLRSSFGLSRTTSGRLNSTGPNLQNIPKGSVVRSAFIPSNGRIFVEADYRRLEVGVLAWYSRDAKLMDDFLADDFHWSVALKIFPDTTRRMLAATTLAELEDICRSNPSLHEFARKQERPLERTESYADLFDLMKTRLRRQSKYTSFGIMYGEGPVALAHPEKGLGVPVVVAAEYIQNWKQTYAVAMRYLNQQVKYAKTERWVESASGRRRRFSYPETLETHIANEAMNHSIQAMASDICLMSLIKLNRILPERGLGDVLLSVHDSILFEVEIARLDEALATIHDVMTTTVTDPDMVFEIDIAVGPNWDDCHGLKVLPWAA